MSQKTEMKISGMKCGGCVSAVEDALKAIEGVVSVNVSLEENQATVLGDVEPEMLVAAVDAAGFKAEL